MQRHFWAGLAMIAATTVLFVAAIPVVDSQERNPLRNRPATQDTRVPGKTSSVKSASGKASAVKRTSATEPTEDKPGASGLRANGKKLASKIVPVEEAGPAKPAKSAGGEPRSATAHLPLFEGWPNPDVALVVTGRQAGYIEPCGCAGLVNQKGGLVRRYTMMNELRSRGWTLVPMDVGNQVKRFGRQSEIKFQMTYEGLKLMDYQAIGLGPDDLRLSTGEVFAAITDQPNRFVSANAAVLDRDLLPRSAAIEANGCKIGVTAVVGDEHREKIRNDEVLLQSAAEGLKLALTQLQREKCDLHVLMVYGSLEETHRLARQFPQFQ